jgi:hypothetical protein
MASGYDIFKNTPGIGYHWVEAAEDISQAKKQLISLASTSPGVYRLWDASCEQFVDLLDDCA